MATLYTQKDKNIRKTWFFMTGFLIFVIGLGWFFSYQFDSPEILPFMVVFASIQAFVSYWWSDKIVLKMQGARQITRDSHREIWNITENLCITAGLPVPKIYIIQDSAPNAFATGRNPKHAAIAVTTGLLQVLDRSELEGVIAHELAHVGNRDMLIATLAVVLVGFVALISDLFVRFSIFGKGGGDRDGGGQAKMIIMLVGLVFMILAPIFASLVQLAISRKREFLADASGALLTRYPEGLASALRKISSHGGKMEKASKTTAHLFISSPFGSRRRSGRRGLSRLFATHPPVEDRIAALTQSNV